MSSLHFSAIGNRCLPGRWFFWISVSGLLHSGTISLAIDVHAMCETRGSYLPAMCIMSHGRHCNKPLTKSSPSCNPCPAEFVIGAIVRYHTSNCLTEPTRLRLIRANHQTRSALQRASGPNGGGLQYFSSNRWFPWVDELDVSGLAARSDGQSASMLRERAGAMKLRYSYGRVVSPVRPVSLRTSKWSSSSGRKRGSICPVPYSRIIAHRM